MPSPTASYVTHSFASVVVVVGILICRITTSWVRNPQFFFDCPAFDEQLFHGFIKGHAVQPLAYREEG
jgi:hypothetical protein